MQAASVLVEATRRTLGERIVGIYLYGSLAYGDFDPEISDIDLLAVVASDLSEREIERLREMHEAFATGHPEWAGRVDANYVSIEGLRGFRERRHPMSYITPGEPFQTIEAGPDWLMNWHQVRASGQAVYGTPAEDVVPEISWQEFETAVRENVATFPAKVRDAERPYQSYLVLTVCRALYTLRFDRQVSKRVAMEWAKGELPRWSDLIERAWSWRSEFRETDVDHEATRSEVSAFLVSVVPMMWSG